MTASFIIKGTGKRSDDGPQLPVMIAAFTSAYYIRGIEENKKSTCGGGKIIVTCKKVFRFAVFIARR